MDLNTIGKQNIAIELCDVKPFRWTQNSEGIYFRGFFFADDTYYQGKDALNYITLHQDDSRVADFLFKLNGIFSLIITTRDWILFAVDRLRSLPLFYTLTSEGVNISENPVTLIPTIQRTSLSAISCAEYLDSTLFVTGEDTLVSDIKQVEAGTFCIYNKTKKTINKVQYFQTEHSDFITDINILTKDFHEAYDRTARNLITALRDRFAIVPLSGGADSRMVLSMLHQQGYKKVLCYTYGKIGNKESKISEQVANHFGYEWIMIPYTGRMWKNLRDDPILKEYERYAFMFTSTPHLQDFIAVKTLKEMGKLPDHCVFVPGHSGDLIAGSHITPDFLVGAMSYENFIAGIRKKFYASALNFLIYEEKLESRFSSITDSSIEILASACEWFNIQERQAKFIINSVRTYEFFGYEWLIPLWDNVLFEFWKHVPISLRYQRRFYFSVTEDSIPSTNDDSFKKKAVRVIKKVPWLYKALLRSERLLKYWNSNLLTEQIIPFDQYLKACLINPTQVSVSYFISRSIVKLAETVIHEE